MPCATPIPASHTLPAGRCTLSGGQLQRTYLAWAAGCAAAGAGILLADEPALLNRALGRSGSLWAWGTVTPGLLLPGPRPTRLPLSRQALERWHRTTSLATMALTPAQALMFAAELVRYN